MPETNGHRDNQSRFDDKLGQLADKLVQLADSQRQTDANVDRLSNVVDKITVDVRILHDTAVLQARTMDHVITNLDDVGGKLNALISVVESDHRDFHERLI